jgi:hypothetical protein
MTYPADQQPSYPTPNVPYPPPRPTNVLAIVALVASFFLPPAGIVCGHLAIGQIRRTGEAGYGLAMAGLIIGYVLTGLILLAIVASIAIPLMFLGVFSAGTIPSG